MGKSERGKDRERKNGRKRVEGREWTREKGEEEEDKRIKKKGR